MNATNQTNIFKLALTCMAIISVTLEAGKESTYEQYCNASNYSEYQNAYNAYETELKNLTLTQELATAFTNQGQCIWGMKGEELKGAALVAQGAELEGYAYWDKEKTALKPMTLSQIRASKNKCIVALITGPGLGDGFCYGRYADNFLAAGATVYLVAPRFTHALYKASSDATYGPNRGYKMVAEIPKDIDFDMIIRGIDAPYYTGIPAVNIEPWLSTSSEKIKSAQETLGKIIESKQFPVFCITASSTNPVPGGRQLCVKDANGTVVAKRDVPWSELLTLVDHFSDSEQKPCFISLHESVNPVTRSRFKEIQSIRAEIADLEKQADLATKDSQTEQAISLKKQAKDKLDMLGAYKGVGCEGDETGRYSVAWENSNNEAPVFVFPKTVSFDDFAALLIAAQQSGPCFFTGCDTGPTNLAAAVLRAGVYFLFNGAGGLPRDQRCGGCDDGRWTSRLQSQDGQTYLEQNNIWRSATSVRADGDMPTGLKLVAADIKKRLNID